MIIAKVLGHVNLQHTHIYARLNTKPVSEALNAHTEQVLRYASRRVMEATPAPPPEDDPVMHTAPVVPCMPLSASTPIPATEFLSEEGMEWPG
jgi:hypothetical protein